MDKPELIAVHFPFRRRMLDEAEIAATKPFHYKGSDTGVLLIHGFTATPAVWQILANKLVQLNFTVSCPVLAGHGNKPEDLLTTSWQDWFRSVEIPFIELEKQCKNIVIVGHSLGGALALQLAAKFPSIQKLFLVAPAVYPMLAYKLLMKSGIPALLSKLGIRFLPPIGGNIKKPDAWEFEYPRTAIHSLQELYACMQETQSVLPQVKMPVVIFQDRKDLLVPSNRAPELLKNIGSSQKELIWFENSYHVIPVDNDADNLVEGILSRI